VPVLNTSVASLPDTGTTMVCAAARLPAIEFKPYVGLTLGSAFVLIYETGQKLPSRDTDHQTACAFRAQQADSRRRENRCSASRRRSPSASGDCSRSYRVSRQPAPGLCILNRTPSVPFIFNEKEEAEYEAQSLGHSKIESTARYLGFEIDDAIEIAQKIDG
jgi:hypothetical protein